MSLGWISAPKRFVHPYEVFARDQSWTKNNASTDDLIRSMHQVSDTLRNSSTSLLSAAVRLASAGEDKEARRLIDLAKCIQEAEDEMRKHVNDARTGRIIKLSTH